MKVAIQGCGIAGPALAFWLKKYGKDVEIFEIAPAFREGGFLIDFWGAGYHVAEKMGVLPQILEHGYQVQNLLLMNEDGKTVGDMNMATVADSMSAPYTSIRRSDLSRALMGALEDVPIHYGVKIDTLKQDADGVDITLSTGETRRFDLVIGADGLHSEIRKMAFGDTKEFERELGVSIAAFTLKNYPHRDEGCYVMFPQIGKQISRGTLRNDECIFYAFVESELADLQHDDDIDAHKSMLKSAFGDAKGEVAEILERMDDAQDFYSGKACQILMKNWSKGRVALLGDAAASVSPLAGEGTGLAILEAYVLAGEIAASRGDHERAFANYQNELQKYLHKKQNAAMRRKSYFIPPNQFSIWLSRMGLRMATLPIISKPLFGSWFTDDFELKDYSANLQKAEIHDA